jgi:hypothetical protein
MLFEINKKCLGARCSIEWAIAIGCVKVFFSTLIKEMKFSGMEVKNFDNFLISSFLSYRTRFDSISFFKLEI